MGKKNKSSLNKISVGKESEIMDKNEITFLINDLDILNSISEICIPSAKDSEFQLGYEGLHIEIKKYDKTVNIMIPLIYYNFKQNVNMSHISYELDDVTKAFEEVKDKADITNLEVFLKSLNLLTKLGYSINYYRGDFGSVHRHPCKSEFSSIDLNNDPNNPGIIYRKSDFIGLQVDAILFIGEDKPERSELFYAEARRINIKSIESGIEGTYKKHECVIVNFREDSNISFDDFLNLKEKERSYFIDNNVYYTKLLDAIMTGYKESCFKPNISYINKDNIIRKEFDFSELNYEHYPIGLFNNSSKIYNDDFVKFHSYYDDFYIPNHNTIESKLVIQAEQENFIDTSIEIFYVNVNNGIREYIFEDLVFSEANDYKVSFEGFTYIMAEFTSDQKFNVGEVV